MIYCLCIMLFLVCISLAVRLFILKNEMKRTSEELRLNRDNSYNRYLTVTLIDKDFNELINEMNKGIDFQMKLKKGNEKYEQRLKQSVSDIAHDLRTPLTVIKGSLQLMESDDLPSYQKAEYLHICQEKTDRLKKMADDFFEMSLLESEKTVVMLDKVNLTRLIMEFIADNETVIREHDLTPDIRLPQKNVNVCGDSQLIVRILENLLNNAVKYAKNSFRLELTECDETSRITFANTAYNIEKADIEHLFERTYRADKARHGEGAGLGLYIVRLLAEKQGGTVYALLENRELSFNVELNNFSEEI